MYPLVLLVSTIRNHLLTLYQHINAVFGHEEFSCGHRWTWARYIYIWWTSNCVSLITWSNDVFILAHMFYELQISLSICSSAPSAPLKCGILGKHFLLDQQGISSRTPRPSYSMPRLVFYTLPPISSWIWERWQGTPIISWLSLLQFVDMHTWSL